MKSFECYSVDFCTLDSECPYLPNRQNRMYYRFIPFATKALTTALIQRGWRRFGYSYFYPICKGCKECKSIRIDALKFKPSKSQRRAIKKNRFTKVVLQEPTASPYRVELYNKYHKFKSQKSGWYYFPIDTKTYYKEFVVGAHDFGKEVLYVIDNKIVGVDLIDILEDGISSIYFYYDPDYGKLSLGIYSLIYQIELARKLGLRWIYLGYWVKGCASFAYKTQFKPYQVLENFPSLEETPNWIEKDLDD